MKKNVIIGITILVGIALLAGAAYLGARLLAQVDPADRSTSRTTGAKVGVAKMGSGGQAEMASLNIQNAPEVPQRAPESSGVVTEIKDNSLIVKDVKGAMVSIEDSGEAKTNYEYQGSAVEVGVTKETQIYQDTTFENLDLFAEMPEDGGTVQQTIESVSFSEIGPQSMISVWGYKRGDRLMAEVILVNQAVSAAQ
jgi:hypothetical protein